MNRIRRTTTKINPNTHPHLFIEHSKIPYEVERRRFVEHVCRILVESRFGLDCVEPVAIDLSNTSLEPILFSDLFDDEGLLPGHALSFISTQGRAYSFALCPSCLRGEKISGTHTSTTTIPPNQGRGSP